jgi:hypothetical protein
MSVAYGVYGPSHPVLGELAYRLSLPVVRGAFASRGFHRPHGRLARHTRRTQRLRAHSAVLDTGMGTGARRFARRESESLGNHVLSSFGNKEGR